jgi:Ca-activated chloride channel family protein
MMLAQPAWLVLWILLPLIAIGGILVARLRKKQWQAFVAPRLRSALLKRGSPLPRWLALTFLLVGASLLIGALARPQGDAGIRTETALGRNVLVALDLSRSMRVSDVKPDRLSQAKVIIYELLEVLPNDRVGLLGFAGRPFLFAPLTIDHAAVKETVEQIDETWAPLGGSDLASAIRLATETLKETGQKNNALIVLSDGEEHEGDLAAMMAEAARSGVYVFAIGIGTEQGGTVPDRENPARPLLDDNNQPVVSRLQPEVLQSLAEETGGRYVVAGSGADIPAMVQAAVQELDSFELEGRERRISVEFYQWLVLPAILFLMVSIVAGTRWRGVRAGTAAVACVAFLGCPTARADEVTDAKRALQNGKFEEARNAYRQLAENTRLPNRAARFRIGEGTAAYRSGDFLSARSAFSHALLTGDPEIASSAHLGIGNTLFNLGWQSLTGEPYPIDPDAVPNLERFDEIVRNRLDALVDSQIPESGETDGFARLRSLLVNWTDAVRHYDSGLAADPTNQAARRNRETTMTYLRRLDELLAREEQETQEQMPEPSEGEGESQPQSGDPGEGAPQEPESNEGGEPEANEGNRGDEPQDEEEGEGKDEDGDEGNEGEEPPDQGDGEESEDDSETSGSNPDETPEERARRKLSENADLERGPLHPGSRFLRDPIKDW